MEINRQRKILPGIMKKAAWICLILAVFCAVYFLVIVIYSGLMTAYCIVWPLMAVVFLMMRRFISRALKQESGMPRFIPTFVFTSFGLFSLIFILIMSMVLKDSRAEGEYENADYTIVLGARVYPDGVSRTLMYRLEEAMEYYDSHPGTTLVLSGGQEPGDAIPEALAMFNYFSLKGVPTAKMIINTNGSSTAELIESSLEKISLNAEIRKIPKGPGDRVWSDDYVPSIAIITSDYHVMRSAKVLKTLGVEDPIEIPARSDSLLFLHQCVRESAAIVKDFLMGNFTLNERDIPFITGMRRR